MADKKNCNVKQVTDRNDAITLSRVTGMILIVLCHIIKYYYFIPGHESLNQFLNCGVQLFIFISGYLYGMRIIIRFKSFLYKRILSVTFPAIIVSVITIIALIIAGVSVSVNSIVVYCLDLEGLLFLNWSAFSLLFSEISSLGPLWFTTIIMLCYLLVPLLQKVCSLKVIKNNFKAFLVVFILLGLVLCIALRSYLEISYFLWFSIGYFTGKIKILDKIRLRHLLVYSVIFVIAIVLRLILHKYYDETDLYLIYSGLSHFILGTWFVVMYSFLNNRYKNAISVVSNSKVVKCLDKYSYYVYLVHGVFCMGVFNVYNDMIPLFISTIVFVLLTVLFAIVLEAIFRLIQRKAFKII